MPITSSTDRAAPDDSVRAVFAHANYRDLFIARLGSMLANQIQAVALGWEVYALTHSAFDLGLVGLFQFLPAVILMLPAGHLADQGDRRRIAQLGLILRTAGVLVLGMLIWQHALSRTVVFGVAVLLGSARAFEMPANSALLPTLVPASQLPRALAISSSGSQAASILGPALGGLLYGVSPSGAFFVCAGLLALAVLTLNRLRLAPQPARPRGAPNLASISAGIRFIVGKRELLGAMSLDLFAVLFGGAVALLPVYARDILHAGPIGVGLLRSAEGVGALVAAFALMRFPLSRHVGKKMFLAVIVFGVATVVFGLSRQLWLSLCALTIVGMADMVSVVVRSSLIQLDTPDAMRGRVSAVNSLFIGTSNQLGEFESGLSAGLLGAVPSVVAGGCITVLIALSWMRLFPALAQRDRIQGAADDDRLVPPSATTPNEAAAG